MSNTKRMQYGILYRKSCPKIAACRLQARTWKQRSEGVCYRCVVKTCKVLNRKPDGQHMASSSKIQPEIFVLRYGVEELQHRSID